MRRCVASQRSRCEFCQTSITRVRARLEIRTERLAFRQGARSASEMQYCWLDNCELCAAIRGSILNLFVSNEGVTTSDKLWVMLCLEFLGLLCC